MNANVSWFVLQYAAVTVVKRPWKGTLAAAVVEKMSERASKVPVGGAVKKRWDDRAADTNPSAVVKLIIGGGRVLMDDDEIRQPANHVEDESGDVYVDQRIVAFVLLRALVQRMKVGFILDLPGGADEAVKGQDGRDDMEYDSGGNPEVEVAVVQAFAVVVIKLVEDSKGGDTKAYAEYGDSY